MAGLKKISGTGLAVALSRNGVEYRTLDKQNVLDVRFFEMVVDTDLTPAVGDAFVNNYASLNTEIGWGDGSTDTISTSSGNIVTHTYATSGEYRIRCVGTIRFRNNDNDGGLTDITRWDYLGFDGTNTGVSGAFKDASFATITAPGSPDNYDDDPVLMKQTFQSCTNFVSGIGGWLFDNTRNYTFTSFFSGCTSFNEDLPWTISITGAASMFSGCLAFNGDISSWDMSGCTNFSSMFPLSSFNQDLPWDVGAGTIFYRMFNGLPYTGNISTWNIGENVTGTVSLFEMFRQCPNACNVNISTDAVNGYWDVSKVSTIQNFNRFGAFSATMNNWNLSSCTNMNSAFPGNGSASGWGSWTINSTPKSTGTNSSVVANALVDSTADFVTDGVSNNDTVKNITDGTFATVTAVTATQLTLSADIFPSPSGDSYRVYTGIDMGAMFSSNTTMNEDIGGWNISLVGNLAGIFKNASSFNQNIDSWDVTGDSFGSMFDTASVFNCGLGNGVSGSRMSGWNLTGFVGSLNACFRNCGAFNQNIGSWDVSGVTDMTSMFNTALRFNQDISGWNTGNVQGMSTMFNNAQDFDQPIGSWNVTSCSNFQSMFRLNTIDQNLGGWTLTLASNMTSMAGGLSTANKALTWIGWESNSPNTGINFTGTFGGTFSKTATIGVDGYDGQSMYRAINSLVAPTPATSRSSGTTTSTTASKLVDSGANFVTAGVQVGDLVTNSTDTTYSYVTAVDSATTLSLNDDIFVTGEAYDVSGGYGATITGVSF
jgi:surface protein